ncbi:MAG: transcriptional repressor [Faecalibacterium sp.]
MRYSRQRELILKKVEMVCSHPTAEEIYEMARDECPSLSLGTVYRNLNSLTDAGRVRRVSVPGQADRFDRLLRPHSHVYCTKCHTVTDVAMDDEAILATIRKTAPEVEDYSLTMFGYCEACRKATQN